ncbi:PKD domain-containing protein [Candidatus Peregrinibacteria bacterium]|nr:PKD domain-containing protein [Candidatus Peregrinibacteria bacterium]
MTRKTQKITFNVLLIVMILITCFHFVEAFAQGDLTGGGRGLAIPESEVAISQDIAQRPLAEVVLGMVNYFIGFLGFVAVITFVYAGVLWVVAGGQDEQITKAKKIMTYSSLGLVVVLLSFSIVTFITSSAGGGVRTCTVTEDCDSGFICDAGLCVPPEGDRGMGFVCRDDTECAYGLTCINGVCVRPSDWACESSIDCGRGEYCSEFGTCVRGEDLICEDNSDCPSPKQCDPYGLCRNPNAGSGSSCEDSSDCPSGFVCNGDKNICEIQGTVGDIPETGAVSGGDTEALTEDALTEADQTINELGAELSNIQSDIESLPQEVQDDVNVALGGGTLADKMAEINSLLTSSNDPSVISVLEKLQRGLQRLLLLREEMDELRLVMPESKETIAEWDKTSITLNELIDDPTSNIKLRRFENLYRSLKDLIRKFPVVISKITAAPGEGNVPFSVTFDGLNSVDPTGGTISDYKWSFLDSSGNQVSLGNSPVIVHEFTEPNTYSVMLQVSTSNKDSDGYKTAMDGISTVRVRANPPSSRVGFRVNGVEVRDVHHVTLDEAKAGISFDPSITVPALGRTIEKYEWFYGDTNGEERTVPATVVHSYKEPGEYFVTLKVTDSIGQTDKRVIKLIVKSLAASIEFIPAEGNVNTEFRFLGINSRSDDGIINNYQWQINDTEGFTVVTSSTESFYHTFDRPGTYYVELIVTDTAGTKDKNMRELNVFSRKPVATFDYDSSEPNHPNTIEFSASGSYDPDQGDQVTYSWDFNGDGQFEIVDSQDVLASYTYQRAGEYKVVLQVQDSFGQRNQSEKIVRIDSVLSGDIILDKKAAQVGEAITFKAESPGSVAYLWEFGDGLTTSTEDKTVTHSYEKKGKYVVKLNFFDRDDNDNSDTTYVLIGEGDSPIAVANVLIDGRNPLIVEDLCGQGLDGYIVTRSDNVSLNARESINRDGSSRLLVYDWKFSNGTRNDRRDFTHRFDEISPSGACSTASLVVRDEISGQASDEDIFYFKVINKLPDIIDFVVESDTERALITPTKIRMKVVGAKDADGQIKKYKWWYYREGFENQLLGVHSTTEPETEMIIVAQGQPDMKNRYFFGVEITDNDGGVFESTERFGEVSYLDVTNGPNLSPVAEFTMDKTTIAVGDSITFVSQSYDPQGDDLPGDAFQWDFDGDGAFDDTTSGAQVNRQFNTPGEYEVRLKVIHRGLSSTARRTVYVEPTNSYPQAAFTYEVKGNTVSFNGSPSRYDPDLTDTTLRFEWDFDVQTDADGNGVNDDDVQSTEVAPAHTFTETRLYRVKLTVLDSLGDEGVVVRDVDLSLSESQRLRGTYNSLKLSAPNQPLTTLELTISPFYISRGETADFIAKVVNADNSGYYGDVFFDVLDGSGEFTPNPVQAIDGRAVSIFTAVDSGPVRIRITATGTYYGDMTEEVILNVQ